jgi:sulfoxide reductase heme-binding subunit YedZ
VGARRRRAALKVAVFSLAGAPAVRLGWQAFQGELGANPIAEALNRLGYWALVCLLASLACTPAQRLFRAAWPLAVRRMLGLFAFAYAALHVSVYVGLDQFFDFGEIGRDIVKRPFITVGTLAFVVLLPLAVTSTNKMVKRLGFSRWKRLHRFVYLAGVAGAVHFFWRVKADHREPLVFAAVLALLLLARWPRSKRRAGDAPASPPLPRGSSSSSGSASRRVAHVRSSQPPFP